MSRALALCVLCGVSLAGCGGGGGSGAPRSLSSAGVVSYTPGVYQPSSGLADQCAAPRTGTAPNGRPYPDRQGSVAAENNFLRSWTNELYLWYDEAPDLNPSSYDDTLEYFDLLKTDEITPSGRYKDEFHFSLDTAEWIALSQSGVEAGYGVQWVLVAAVPPRRIVVPYVQPGSPAASAGLARGDEVLAVDGADAVNGDTQTIVNTLNAGLFPSSSGQAHTFRIRSRTGAERTVNMTSANVTYTPVPIVTTIDNAYGRLGYLLFNDHIATAEAQLVNAVQTLQAAQITDLVLDIRYNGGGYLDIASELAYMIGGSATAGRTFERMVFNDKHPSTNPVTDEPLTPTPFHTTTQGFNGAPPSALPSLNLPGRVYVLTGPNTCSASEAIINGLRGVGLDVYQIGSTTCGKPYGFYPRDNCGTTYFSIQFQGVNDAGFGDYADGFGPNNTAGASPVRLPGCSVADDFSHELGDPLESRLAAAISYRASNNTVCPAATGYAPGAQAKTSQPLSQLDGVMRKSPARTNRILRDM